MSSTTTLQVQLVLAISLVILVICLGDQQVPTYIQIPAPAFCIEDFDCRKEGHGQKSYCDALIKKCSCYPGYFFDDGFHCISKYEEYTDPNSPQRICATDTQCQSHFGQLTVCSRDKMCECFDTLSDGQNKVVFYNARCVIARMNGESCTRDEECQAGHHRDSFCAPAEPEDKYGYGPRVCRCRAGLNCDFGHSGAGFKSVVVVTVSTIFLGLVATQVIL